MKFISILLGIMLSVVGCGESQPDPIIVTKGYGWKVQTELLGKMDSEVYKILGKPTERHRKRSKMPHLYLDSPVPKNFDYQLWYMDANGMGHLAVYVLNERVVMAVKEMADF